MDFRVTQIAAMWIGVWGVMPQTTPAQAPSTPPETLYTIRIDGIATTLDQGRITAELSDLGYASVDQRTDGLLRSVNAGLFELLLDAQLCAEDLRLRGFPRVRVQPVQISAEDSPRRSLLQSDHSLPLPPIFQLEASHISETPDHHFNMEDEVALAVQRAEALRTAEGDAELQQIAMSLPEDDPRRAWATLRYAHRLNWTKSWDEAQALYLAVANGSFPVSHRDRTKAMINVGWMYEYRIGDRRAAYRANRELAQFTSSPEVRARARTEISWVLFEMVQHEEIGTWEEVRAYCADTVESIPNDTEDPEMQKWRAVSQLIRFETYYREQDYTNCVIDAEAFIAEHQDTPVRRREVGMARAWLGLSAYRCGNMAVSKEKFAELIDMQLRPGENFGGENLDRLAAAWLVHLAHRTKDDLERDTWISYLESRHPDAPILETFRATRELDSSR